MEVNGVGGINVPQAAKECDCKACKTKINSTNLEYQPTTDEVTFSGKNAEGKKKASIGKKIGVGVASYVVPGLGQLINGEGKKAAGFLAGSIASIAVCAFCPPVGLLGAIGCNIGSIVDAVKNA